MPQAIEQTFDGVVRQHELRFVTTLATQVAETPCDGRGNILGLPLGHVSDSKYGRMTFATRHTLAQFQRSSMLPFLSRR